MSQLSFSALVLKWFDQYGRKTLPWQVNIDPYRVYLSEIMLQQTQVSTVIPYFQRFIEAFPTINALASAPLDRVLQCWTGLGYYARARNLHQAAKQIIQRYGEGFPQTQVEWMALPGVGRSTAAAICAIVYGQRCAILDGNVKRVLARYMALKSWPGEKKAEAELWALAESLLPKKRMPDYTQAMMDMGALLCTRSSPKCDLCPLQSSCLAYASGQPTDFPVKRAKRSLPIRVATLLIVRDQKNRVLLERQAMKGIWGGLWSLPKLQGSLQAWCQKNGLDLSHYEEGISFRHSFSHYHLNIVPITVWVKRDVFCVEDGDSDRLWYNFDQPVALGFPQPVAKLLKVSE